VTSLRRIGVPAALLAVAAAAAAAAAPAPEKVRGTIVSVADGRIVVNDGTDHPVALADATRYRLADDATARFTTVQRTDLKPGEYVTISMVPSSPAEAPVAQSVFVASDQPHLAAAWKQQVADAKAAATRPAAAAATTQPSARSPLIPAVKIQNTQRFLELHAQYVKRAHEGNVDVLFLGDSITYGWHRWAQKLFDERYGPRAANFGVDGDRIEHVLWRIENGELDGIKPKVIVLLIGTNNSNVDDGTLIAAGVKNLIDQIHKRTPTSKFLVLSIFPRAKPDDKKQMPRIDQANPLIAKLDNGTTVRVLDLRPEFVGPDGKLKADLFHDQLHPNAAGYQVWADTMQPVLDQLLKD
jgi:lysophospholipase L1-like esterase